MLFDINSIIPFWLQCFFAIYLFLCYYGHIFLMRRKKEAKTWVRSKRFYEILFNWAIYTFEDAINNWMKKTNIFDTIQAFQANKYHWVLPIYGKYRQKNKVNKYV